MNYQDFVNKVRDLHFRLENSTGNVFQIEIKGNNDESTIIGDLSKRRKTYFVRDMEFWKSLEGTYNSEQEFKQAVDNLNKRYGQKRIVFISEHHKAVMLGRGRLRDVGKVDIEYL